MASSISKSLSEKYRPSFLENVKGQDQCLLQLQMFARHPTSAPNLIFFGPPGCGKSSCAFAFVRQSMKHYFQHSTEVEVEQKINQFMPRVILQKNASDENGIDVIRSEVNSFVTNRAMLVEGFPLKFVILDEADMLTKHSQCILRRVMEDYIDSVKFILICNDDKKIHEAIMSRCTLLFFSGISNDDIVDIVSGVVQKESPHHPLSRDAIFMLAQYHQGDCRKTLNDINNILHLKLQDEKQIGTYLGIPSKHECEQFIQNIIRLEKPQELIVLCEQWLTSVTSAGMDLKVWIDQLFHYCLDESDRYISFLGSWLKIWHNVQIGYHADCEWKSICFKVVSEMWLSTHLPT